MRSPALLGATRCRNTCNRKYLYTSAQALPSWQTQQLLTTLASGALLTWAAGSAEAEASANPSPSTVQPAAQENAILQKEPQSSDGIFPKPVDAPALRDGQCQGKEECEKAAAGSSTEQQAQPPKKKRQSRMQELQEAREELQTKEQELRQKSGELQAIASEKDQTIAMLQDELDIERMLRSLLERDKEKAEEIAALAMNLCSGVTIPP